MGQKETKWECPRLVTKGGFLLTQDSETTPTTSQTRHISYKRKSRPCGHSPDGRSRSHLHRCTYEPARSLPRLNLRAARSHDGITLLFFSFVLTPTNDIAIFLDVTDIILGALALARRRDRRGDRRGDRRSGIRLCRMSARRAGRVRVWTYLSLDHLRRPLRCLRFGLRRRLNECRLSSR